MKPITRRLFCLSAVRLGTWGLAEMTVWDKADNKLYVDFTEIVRFEVEEGAPAAPIIRFTA